MNGNKAVRISYIEEYFGVNILLCLIIYANWIKVYEDNFALIFIYKDKVLFRVTLILLILFGDLDCPHRDG